MHKVDPMEVMLSDIFDKVFYSKDQEPSRKVCEDCDGDGWYEAEYPRPQGFDRDVGYLDTKRVECEWCGGTGLLEDEEPNEYCVGCECILRWDESEKYCRWCEERMEKEQDK